jgi:hypothetical protein
MDKGGLTWVPCANGTWTTAGRRSSFRPFRVLKERFRAHVRKSGWVGVSSVLSLLRRGGEEMRLGDAL